MKDPKSRGKIKGRSKGKGKGKSKGKGKGKGASNPKDRKKRRSRRILRRCGRTSQLWYECLRRKLPRYLSKWLRPANWLQRSICSKRWDCIHQRRRLCQSQKIRWLTPC